MSAIEFNWSPTDRQLRQFGWIALFALPFFGWMFTGQGTMTSLTQGQSAIIGTLAGVGGFLAIAGHKWPRLVKPAFLGLSLVTFPIGLVLSELTILFLYLCVFTPVALLFKVIGRDALERKLDDSGIKTYWHPKQQSSGKSSYFRQS